VVYMGVVDTKIEQMMPEVLFRAIVSSLAGRRISRTRLYELRSELNQGDLSDEEFTPGYARTVAYYAKLRTARRPPQIARTMTIKFCKEHQL